MWSKEQEWEAIDWVSRNPLVATMQRNASRVLNGLFEVNGLGSNSTQANHTNPIVKSARVLSV